MEILIQPIGSIENEAVENLQFSGDQTKGSIVLLMLKKSLKEIFRIKCHISNDTMEIPEKAYNPSRNQYYSTGILSLMMNILKTDSSHIVKIGNLDIEGNPRVSRTAKSETYKNFNFVVGETQLPSVLQVQNAKCLHVIGVTEVDLYVPGLNFVFGEAECPGNFAIISLHRLKNPNRGLYLKRVLIEAVHELGHTFGLPHCKNHLCVMHFSNSIVETDIKGTEFCKDCLKGLKIV